MRVNSKFSDEQIRFIIIHYSRLGSPTAIKRLFCQKYELKRRLQPSIYLESLTVYFIHFLRSFRSNNEKKLISLHLSFNYLSVVKISPFYRLFLTRKWHLKSKTSAETPCKTTIFYLVFLKMCSRWFKFWCEKLKNFSNFRFFTMLLNKIGKCLNAKRNFHISVSYI